MMQTQTLISQILKNRQSAFEQFYHQYANRLFRVAFRYINNEQDAGSIVNQSFHKIFHKLSDFEYRNEASLIAWMQKITANEALQFIRASKPFDEITEQTSSELYEDNKAIINLSAEEIYKLVKNLPEEYRIVFNLFVIEGYSHAEIAIKLSIKESSSRVYLTRARKYLQEKIIIMHKTICNEVR